MDVSDPAPVPRSDLAGFIQDIERLETIFETWDQSARGAAEAYRRAIEALHGEALRRLIRALKSDPAALAAMKSAVADEIVYAVLRRHDIIKPSLNERVESALDGVRPMLASHGGNVELIAVAPPAIEVRFTGACDGCGASALTFHAGVKKAVQESCPEITEVRQAKGLRASMDSGKSFVSPFALAGSAEWLTAGQLSDIPEGGILIAELAGEKVLLFRQAEIVTCFQNTCVHLGLALDDGRIDDGIISCSHHGFRYDLRNGECLTVSGMRLRSYAVRVVAQQVDVRLPQ